MRKFITNALRHVQTLKRKRLEREAALAKAMADRRVKKISKHQEEVEERKFVMRAIKVILLLLLFGVAAWVFYEARGIVFMFLVAFLIASALDPLAARLKRHKIPITVTVIGIFVLFFVSLVLFGSRIVPLLSSQLVDLAQKFGNFFTRFQTYDPSEFRFEFLRPFLVEAQKAIELGNLQTQLQDWLQVIASGLFKLKDNVWEIFKGVGSGVLKFMLVLLISYLMIIEQKNIRSFFLNLIPAKYSSYAMKNVTNIKDKMGHWLFGRLLLSIGVGFLTYLVLLILRIPSAATLGIMMGIFDVVPIVGPFFAWLFILPVAFNMSIFTVIWMSIGVLAVQWFENNVMIPYIMKKAMGIPSITIVLALLVGSHFFGIIGLVLAVPVAAMLAFFWNDYFTRH